MWTTVPHLAIAKLRGFRYVTNFAWDKIKIGTGYWNRNRQFRPRRSLLAVIPKTVPGAKRALVALEKDVSLMTVAFT